MDGDASILTGSPVIRSNEALLWAVRDARPEAHILFKPHPDVVAGNRAGAISAECLAHCVDSQVLDLGLTSLYPHVDELHTMTSLSGFEALVQGVNVTTGPAVLQRLGTDRRQTSCPASSAPSATGGAGLSDPGGLSALYRLAERAVDEPGAVDTPVGRAGSLLIAKSQPLAALAVKTELSRADASLANDLS
ncbi:hypothetical protein PSK30_24190 [Escherichia coli]|uniref:capsular polysaccharide export protein, LipB/KpsS family n=1 Tax=Escherichia coli TaxID=562 RepID=UPI002359824A|nr:hypothetical protein [Escherichia coli]